MEGAIVGMNRWAMFLSVLVFAVVTLSSSPSLGTVDPDKIVINEEGDPITGAVNMNLKDDNQTIIAYNVYDDVGDPIGTLTSWSYTGQDVVNITEANTGQTFVVRALKVGTATLTVKSQGDTKNMTASVTIKVTDEKSSASTAKKGFIPGYEALFVLAAVGTAAVAISKKPR